MKGSWLWRWYWTRVRLMYTFCCWADTAIVVASKKEWLEVTVLMICVDDTEPDATMAVSKKEWLELMIYVDDTEPELDWCTHSAAGLILPLWLRRKRSGWKLLCWWHTHSRWEVSGFSEVLVLICTLGVITAWRNICFEVAERRHKLPLAQSRLFSCQGLK